MQKLIPFLCFDGRAEEAVNLYVTLLPNSRIDRVTRSPLETHSNEPGSVLTIEFTLAGQQYVAMNVPQFKFTEAVSLQILCEDQAEVDRLWSTLTSNGGRENVCGWLQDKFGLSWQITPRRLMQLVTHEDRDLAKRAMQAMMTMGKIDIAALEAAVA
jgi:predicted 3-demethylubiquinone-9 3-methyltransferase (glyoxalase superfamily)